MDYFLMLSLGLAFGILLIYLLRPALFVRQKADFAALEAMFEEFIEELDTKQELFREEIEQFRQEFADKEKQLDQRLASLISPSPANIPSPKVRAVLELAQEGIDEVDIAKKLGLGKGEVQLILELNRKNRE